jgi:hypothetical protein
MMWKTLGDRAKVYFLVVRRFVVVFAVARPLVGRRFPAGAFAIISLAWS